MKKGSILCLFTWGLALLCAADAAEADMPPRASVVVDASKIFGKVPTGVFGHNLEACLAYGIDGVKDEGKPMPQWMKDKIGSGDGVWDAVNGGPLRQFMEMAKPMGIGSLRYPGGCLAHNWDWRQSVGPVEKRGDWKFGLDEYLRLCAALGAEPVITVSDYLLPVEEMPAHAAALVEYLNAPATPGHPWAMKRKEWGHPEPYGVKWFELGNESNHGNHSSRPRRHFSPEAYAQYALAMRQAMKAVDPSIKVGVLMVPGLEFDCEWNRTVLKLAGKSSDFVIVHFYAPSMGSATDLPESDAELMQACMAMGEQIDYYIRQFHRVIREEVGRELPLAVTEFNAGFSKPEPEYRFTYGAALDSADMVRIFLKPDSNVVLANYWQLINGFWGLMKSRPSHPEDPKMEPRPAHSLFQLWGSHFGGDLVSCEVSSPRASYTGSNPRAAKAVGTSLKPPELLKTYEVTGLDFDAFGKVGITGERLGDGVISMVFRDYQGYQLPLLAKVSDEPAGDLVSYQISYEARFVPDEGSSRPIAFSFYLCDLPGADKGHAASQFNGVSGPEWKIIRQTYLPQRPKEKLAVYAKFESGPVRISGRMEIRNLKVEKWSVPKFPEFPLVTAAASLSEKKDVLHVMLFNKSADEAIRTTIDPHAFGGARAALWQVNGPSLEAMSDVRETIRGESVPMQGGKAVLDLPAHSMTALEFYREGKE